MIPVCVIILCNNSESPYNYVIVAQVTLKICPRKRRNASAHEQQHIPGSNSTQKLVISTFIMAFFMEVCCIGRFCLSRLCVSYLRHSAMHRHVLFWFDLGFVQTFACDHLEEMDKTYLRADYSLECDTHKHNWFKFYSAVMILVSVSTHVCGDNV